jgi:predicted ABC-type ATPase
LKSRANPRLMVFAGPNGAGKSTFYRNAETQEGGYRFWIVNPDLLTTEIAEREGQDWLAANGVALDRIMAWLRSSIAMYRPVGFETVLSSDKYFPLIDDALALGFELHLIYVALRTPELHLERIRKRVSEGGHDVAPDKVIARRLRSFANLERLLPKASFAQVWDNSGVEPKRLFEKRGDRIEVLDRKAIPEITQRVLAASRAA